jgi:hypothetical protein
MTNEALVQACINDFMAWVGHDIDVIWIQGHIGLNDDGSPMVEPNGEICVHVFVLSADSQNTWVYVCQDDRIERLGEGFECLACM